MAAGSYDITIEQGATFSLVLTWKDENGALINLTGFSARMQIRENVESEDVIASLATSGSGIVLGGALGTITITIDAAITATIRQTFAVYDLELQSASGVVTRLVQGAVTISPEVTR